MQRDDDLCQCPVKVGPHWETEECRAQEAALARMRTRGLAKPDDAAMARHLRDGSWVRP